VLWGGDTLTTFVSASQSCKNNTTTVADFERQPELAACMSVFLGDVVKWQKKKSQSLAQGLRAP
jgi:hypothetical protein